MAERWFSTCYRIATNSSLGGLYSLRDGGVNLLGGIGLHPGQGMARPSGDRHEFGPTT
ncbi:hypothetical protein SFHH103_01498 [Sinorhizobium fredii HH103]|uniref:Uncharacterized protein n=1 Tax=Sinorhizobium fredii (strain HH103) TaxID=1117943 RepID=G9A6W6_SINF1|nr:hypothetical protein SF83666_c16200 [Sinorhizobium fredii CCBAU 83666]CCE95996.1 hypothetical protein SFHH103_01498 [Sinorhizobium fredii HH103]